MAAMADTMRAVVQVSLAGCSSSARANPSSVPALVHIRSSAFRATNLTKLVAAPVRRRQQSGRDLRVYADAATSSAAAVAPAVAPAITLTENALAHLRRLRAGQKSDLLLRVGVRQGGCSGMSYVMDFEERAKIRPDDSIIDYEDFAMVCDPKSLLFLFGMRLDYSDALIGGGFSFSNPNATSTCGCGKSFAA